MARNFLLSNFNGLYIQISPISQATYKICTSIDILLQLPHFRKHPKLKSCWFECMRKKNTCELLQSWISEKAYCHNAKRLG